VILIWMFDIGVVVQRRSPHVIMPQNQIFYRLLQLPLQIVALNIRPKY